MNSLFLMHRFGLIGVLGAAGACKSDVNLSVARILRYPADLDISIRFMGSRAHTMHSMATFSLVSIMFSGFTCGICSTLILFLLAHFAIVC